MFVLLDKKTLGVVEELSETQKRAIQAVMEGSTDRRNIEPVCRILDRAHSNGFWLGCDCQGDDRERPVAATVRNHTGTLHWRVLGDRPVQHSAHCVFHRTQVRERGENRTSDSPQRAPTGNFQVLRNPPPSTRLSVPSDSDQVQTGRGGRHSPALSRRLLQLVQLAGLNRVRPDATTLEPQNWRALLRERTSELNVAPGQPLSRLWFDHPVQWSKCVAHASVRAAARNGLTNHWPQGFLCWVVSEVGEHSVATSNGRDLVNVVASVRRPMIGENPVPGPYLFLGVVGLPEDETGYQCLQAYAQPIVAGNCPVAVDSHNERRAFGSLRTTTLRILRSRFPDAAFELEKPQFDKETNCGPCLPDFLIRATRKRATHTFVIEFMGFDRPDYLQGKAITHIRMEKLGPLCLMDALEFDRRERGLTDEGRKVTHQICSELQRIWRKRRLAGQHPDIDTPQTGRVASLFPSSGGPTSKSSKPLRRPPEPISVAPPRCAAMRPIAPPEPLQITAWGCAPRPGLEVSGHERK